jgi:hypothetical protein
LLPFLLIGPFRGKIKECTSPFKLREEQKLVCLSDYTISSNFFSFPL